MQQIRSWEVSDELWQRVEPFIPLPGRIAEEVPA